LPGLLPPERGTDLGKRRDPPPIVEPHWAPLARPVLSRAQAASIVAQNLVPLAGLWLLRGSVENFLLLSVFNIAFAIAGIVAVGVGVSARQELGDRGTADALASLGTLAMVTGVITLVLTALFGWVIALVASGSVLGLWNAPLGWSVLSVVIVALPGMVSQYRADLAANRPDETRKQRDQPVILGHVLCAGLVFMLSGYAPGWGRAGMILMAVAVTALFIFRDLRPDLVRQLVRPSARPPGGPDGPRG
jgi:hypothetical protein